MASGVTRKAADHCLSLSRVNQGSEMYPQRPSGNNSATWALILFIFISCWRPHLFLCAM